MPERQLAVVINPSSAGGKPLRLWPSISEKLRADGFEITSHISLNESDFRNQLRKFSRKFKYIGICGGDSSLTIAAEELHAAKFSGELQFIPAGSVNDFALEFSNTKSALFIGKLRSQKTTKLFLGQVNWGLGVVVNRWVGKILGAMPIFRPLQNPIGALCLIFAHLLRREIVRAQIEIDGKIHAGAYSIILVSQIKHWAGGMQFCPNADAYSAKFQIILLPRQPIWGLMNSINKAKSGSLDALSGKQISVKFSKPKSAQVDGDLTEPAMEFHSSKVQTRFSLRSSGD